MYQLHDIHGLLYFVLSASVVVTLCMYSGQCLKNGLSDLIQIWHVDVTGPQGVPVTYIGHYISTLYITYIRHYISALFNLSFMFIHCHKR